MSTSFIPLLPDTGSTPQMSRVTSPEIAASATGTFTSLLPVSQSASSPGAHVESSGPGSQLHAHDRLPVVTLKREADRVTRIQVRCSCGEVIELDCVY